MPSAYRKRAANLVAKRRRPPKARSYSGGATAPNAKLPPESTGNLPNAIVQKQAQNRLKRGKRAKAAV